MVAHRKNISVLVSAVSVEHPAWGNVACIQEATRLWDDMFNQQKQFAQVRANRLKKPFLVVSTPQGGVDIVAAEIYKNSDAQVYQVVNPQFKEAQGVR